MSDIEKSRNIEWSGCSGSLSEDQPTEDIVIDLHKDLEGRRILIKLGGKIILDTDIKDPLMI
jgi:hypothetical protein